MASTLQSTVTRVRNLITRSVINNYLQAVSRKDIDQLLTEYTEESTIITTDGTYQGLEASRAFYEQLFRQFDGIDIEPLKQEVAGDVAYITWHEASGVALNPVATGTFIVKRGKIHTQTFSLFYKPNLREKRCVQYG